MKLFNKTECPDCGWRYHDLIITNRLGCGSCYETFKDYIEKIIAEKGETIQNLSYPPQKTDFEEVETSQIELEEHLIFLRRKMEDAIAEEAFEKANNYLEEIIQIQKKLEK